MGKKEDFLRITDIEMMSVIRNGRKKDMWELFL